MKLYGRASVLDGGDGRDPALVLERQNEDGRRAYLVEALNRERTLCTKPGQRHRRPPHRALPRRTPRL